MDSQQQRQQASEVKIMLSSLGWKYAKEDLEAKENLLIDELINEVDEIKKGFLQADIRAIRKLFRSLEAWANIGT